MHRGARHFGFARLRLIAVLAALLSFTLQTYVVQTHIHAQGVQISGLGQAGHTAPDNRNSQDDCPICQAFAATGAFVTPALIVLALALTFIDVAPVFARGTRAGPVLTRNWRSRAPPQH